MENWRTTSVSFALLSESYNTQLFCDDVVTDSHIRIKCHCSVSPEVHKLLQ